MGGLPDLTIERMCLALLLGCVVTTFVLRREPMGALQPVEIGLWAYALACGLSALMHGGFDGGKAADTMNALSYTALYPAIAVMIVTRTQTSSRDLMWFSAILTLFAIYLGVTAILERTPYTWALFPPAIGDPAEGMHWGRSRGPFVNAAIDGTVLAQLLPVALLLREVGTRVWRGVAIVAVCLISAGVYLTDTRVCLLALVVVTIVGSLLQGPSRGTYRVLLVGLLLAGLIRFTIGAVLVPRLDDTDPVDTRLNLMLASAEMILAHPVLGAGFGTFQELSREYYNAARIFGNLSYQKEWANVGSHSNFLTPIAEMGLLMGGLYLFLTVRVMASSFREPLGRTPEEQARVRGLLVCSLLVGVPFLLNGLAGDFKYFLTPNALFWTFGAFAERHARLRAFADALPSAELLRFGAAAPGPVAAGRR
jgi:hypothetical protein